MSRTDAVLAARAVHTAIESCGTAAVLDDSTVLLPSMAMKVRIAEVDVQERGAVVVYDIAEKDSEMEGIQVLAVGFGSDPHQALAEAAFQWTTGVFTTVRHYVTPETHTCFVDDVRMIVRTTEPPEEFVWRVHLGPIVSRVFGPDEDDVAAPVEPVDVFKVLFDAVHRFAAHRTLFWIEAYVVRYPDGNVEATCRFRNDDFAEGADALMDWAESWDIEGDATVSVRQFLLFQPDRLSPAPEPAPPRAPWWKRLFAK